MASAAWSRRRYIDWARGVAVLVMIEAHTFDAWTRAADKSTRAYQNAMILGGFAAPLFLFLAGLAVPLAARAALRKTGSRRAAGEAVISRGLVIFILAFAFRLQAFIVSPGNSLLSIFRVDILNIMGPAIAITAAAWLLTPTPLAFGLVMATGAVTVAMVTPVVRLADWVALLPTWLQWYMRPAGEYTTFSLFPWSGFVFAGAAIGTTVADTEASRERRVLVLIGAAGAFLVGLGFYTAARPSIYAQSSFWTTSPTFFAIRVGTMAIALSLIYGFDQIVNSSPVVGPLQRIGQNSLFVYWIHVELVYGYASWLLLRRLPFAGTCLAYVLFVALMYGAVLLKDRMLEVRKASRHISRPPHPIPAR